MSSKAYIVLNEVVDHDANYSTQQIKEFNEQLTNLCQLMIWGDKNQDSYFDYFCEQKTMSKFLLLIDKSQNQKEIQIGIIKTMTMLLQNISKPPSLNYLLSNPTMNKFIQANFNFHEDEIIAYYINFIKSIAIRLDQKNIIIFFNAVFTLSNLLIRNQIHSPYSQLLFNFTAIRKIQQKPQQEILCWEYRNVSSLYHNTLLVHYLQPLQKYLSKFPFVQFYIQYALVLKQQYFTMSQILIDKSLSKLKHLDLYLDDSVDSVYFVEDLLTINPHCEISFLNSLIAFAFLPTIFSTLMPQNINKVSTKLAIYLLIIYFKNFKNKTILNYLTKITLNNYLTQVALTHHLIFIDCSLFNTDPKLWQSEENFLFSYCSVFFGKKCEYWQDLIKGNEKIGKEQLIEDAQTIGNILNIEELRNANNKNALSLNGLNKGNEIFNQILICLESEDDGLVYLVLKLFRQIQQKQSELEYNMWDQQETRQIMIQQLLRIIELSGMLYGIGTLIVSCQILLVSKSYLTELNLLQIEQVIIFLSLSRYLQIFKRKINKIYEYVLDPSYTHYLCDYFAKEYKQYSGGLLKSMTPLSYLNLKDNENNQNNFLFIKPRNSEEQVYQDIIILFIMKELMIILFKEIYKEKQLKILERSNPFEIVSNERVEQKFECIYKDENVWLIFDQKKLRMQQKNGKMIEECSLKIIDEQLNDKRLIIQIHSTERQKQIELVFKSAGECRECKKCMEMNKIKQNKEEYGYLKQYFEQLLQWLL